MIDLVKKMRIRTRNNYKRAIRKTYRNYKIELMVQMLFAEENRCRVLIPSEYRLATRLLARKAGRYGFTYRINFVYIRDGSDSFDLLTISWDKRP